jgi:cobalt-zinc-cadmium efflux system protein
MSATHVHNHHHDHRDSGHAGSARRLVLALLLTLGFALIEATGGFWSGSLALLGDAGHMFFDAAALGIAMLAAWIARRPPSARHSYGLVRAEVVAALFNSLLMLAVVVSIVVEAIERLQTPRPVTGMAVMVIAALGLLVNLFVLAVLSRGTHDLNTRGAVLHVLGDLLGSVAALIAGAVIFFTGWLPIDPLLSLLICVLILYSTLRLLRESVHVLMEGVPRHLDLEEIGRSLAAVPGAVSVHDLHIWAPDAGRPVLSAHVVVDDLDDWMGLLERMATLLETRYGIDHVTLQPETRAGRVRPVPLKRRSPPPQRKI